MSRFRLQRMLGTSLLSASLLFAGASVGCSGRVRVYDDYHSDWHTWDGHEDVAYRAYWTDRHEQYRDYKALNKDEQKDYWKWRHDHPDKH